MQNPFTNSPLAKIGVEAAKLAGEVLRRGFGTTFLIEAKTSKLNLVTEYDKASEKIIIDHIRKTYPEHGFLAEETGASLSKESPVLWVIDPLDGTMNFAHDIPIFTISIAALVNGQVEIGIIYQPMTDELFIANKENGAYLNGLKLKVSSVSSLDFAVGSTGFPYDMNETRRTAIKQFNSFLQVGNPIRILGSAALHLAYVSAGRFDLYWGATLHPWDIAAGKILVEEAGGVITHYDGSPHTIFDNPTVIAANAQLHREFLNKLNA